MALGDKDDSQIVDVDSYDRDENEAFSRSVLVMKTCRKCLELGCKEMMSGYWNVKTDKFGNSNKSYIQDSRKAFIESIESLEMVMIPDIKLDEDISKKIKELKSKLTKRFKQFLEMEMNYFITLNLKQKQKLYFRGIIWNKDFLNKELQYYQEYMFEQVLASREIFKLLMELTEGSAKENYQTEEGDL